MKLGSIRYLFVFSLLSGLLAGCASNSSGPATTADSATQKKGHWITVGAETGSMIPRRVWVDDNGQTSAGPGVNNVTTGSAGNLQKVQNGSGTTRPPGS
jgi:hypothetical protein